MVCDKIRNAGLKVTPQRKLVYEIVQDLAHATIEDIVSRVQKVDSQITVSTVYRILNSFYDSNLLGRVCHPNGKIYYDINTYEHHHIFTSKQMLIDINDAELSEFIRSKIEAQIGEGEQIEKISVQIITSIKN